MISSDPVLTRDEAFALGTRVLGFHRGTDALEVRIMGSWRSDIRWGRNHVTAATEGSSTTVQVICPGNEGSSQSWTDQIDDDSLRAVVRTAERYRRMVRREPDDLPMPWVKQPLVDPPSWSAATVGLDAAACGAVAQTAVPLAAREGMLCAGYLSATASLLAYVGSDGASAYSHTTHVQFSMTSRDDARRSAGWAGVSSFDWGRIDSTALAARAVDKAMRMRNPVAIEPGRYTVVLEPQAVADVLSLMMDPLTLDRQLAEASIGPFAWKPGFSKLGQRVADPRVTIGQDPMKDLGMIPFDWYANPMRAVNWIEEGILVNLGYSRPYALEELNENWASPVADGYHMLGGTTSIDEMIATTTRGVLVTRMSNMLVLDRTSRLGSGVTRDGVWLIERGKISKPVTNLRFTESPLFVLNNIEALGVPVPVFQEGGPVTVPPVKARDFSFTSLSESV